MIRQTKKQMFVLAAIASIGLSASAAFAQTQDIVVDGTGVIPYLIDSRNVVARSGTGLCWRTGFWTPAAAETALAGQFPVGCACDADIMPAELCTVQAMPAVEVPVARAVQQKIKLSADTLFDFDKATLRPEGMQRLQELAMQARQINLEVVLAVGHTDRIGTVAYNQKLSDRRAEAVKAYLITQGIDASRIYTEGKGKSMPITGDSCKAGQGRTALIRCLQPDRRVEIELIGTTTAAPGNNNYQMQNEMNY